MYKFSFYVPLTHLESVKTAVFSAGAGKTGNYSHCAWQTQGKGQFCSLEGSTPFVGEQGILTTVDEYKVEMVCERKNLKKVLQAFKEAHPYEEPAFDIWELSDPGEI